MSVYISLLKIRLQLGLQYRVAAIAGVLTQLCFGWLFLMIYEAFYRSRTGDLPMSFRQLVDYIWLQQAFLAFIMLWFRDGELFEMITSGNIACELCRPVNLYGFWYVRLLAQRLSAAMLRCLPVLVVACLMPGPYRIHPPHSAASGMLAAVTLVLGLLIITGISMTIYISVFITLSPVGSTLMIGVLGEFLAGLVVPVPLMPGWLQVVTNLLPFRLTSDLPFRIYSGQMPLTEGLAGLGVQLLWLAVLVAGGNAWLNRMLRRVVIQGG